MTKTTKIFVLSSLMCAGCLDLEMISQDQGLQDLEIKADQDSMVIDQTQMIDMKQLSDMPRSLDLLVSEDMATTHDMLMTEDMIVSSDVCVFSYEVCDGQDNDCDGQIDESHWVVSETARGLSVTFSEDSDLRDAQITVAIKSSTAPYPFIISNQIINANLLGSQRTFDYPDAIAVRFEVVEASDSGWSYRVESITDLSSELRPLPPPYPEGAQGMDQPAQTYQLSNNLSEGALCSQCPEEILSECFEGNVICPGEIPTPIETCNNIDDDCDGAIDEGLVRKCSGQGALGVCGEVDSTCDEGVWSSCEFEDLKDRTDRFGELINDAETCDCYDNNCNGVTDEPSVYGHETTEDLISFTAHNCSPDLTRFTSPDVMPAECHFRPLGVNDRNQPIPHVLRIGGTYYLDKLVIHEDTLVRIVKPIDDEGPGYLQADVHRPCIQDNRILVGGNLTVVARDIEIQTNARLEASSYMSHCNTQSSGSSYQNYAGASGGNLWLLANTIDIQGVVAANGSSPTNGSAGYQCYNAFSGGAAGSIYLIAPNISLSRAQIIAEGGLGACSYTSVSCGSNSGRLDRMCDPPSIYSGGGPGGLGGMLYGSRIAGGAGSGGSDFRQVDPSRNIRVIGSIEANPDSMIAAHNGNQMCDGHLLLSAGTLGLWDSVSCTNTPPDTFLRHQLTFMALDARGRPVVSDEIHLEIHSLTPLDESQSNTLVYEDGALLSRGAITLPASELTPGSFYKLKIIDTDVNVDISSINFLFQSLGSDQVQNVQLSPDDNGEIIFNVPDN